MSQRGTSSSSRRSHRRQQRPPSSPPFRHFPIFRHFHFRCVYRGDDNILRMTDVETNTQQIFMVVSGIHYYFRGNDSNKRWARKKIAKKCHQQAELFVLMKGNVISEDIEKVWFSLLTIHVVWNKPNKDFLLTIGRGARRAVMVKMAKVSVSWRNNIFALLYGFLVWWEWFTKRWFQL